MAGRHFEGRVHLDDEWRGELLAAESEHHPVRYGTLLFESLFHGEDVLAGYRESLAVARSQEKRLRLRLYLANQAPAELHRLHWEYLYDAKGKFPLGCSQDTALSRFQSVDLAPPPPVEGRLGVLVVLSAPRDLEERGLPGLDREAMRRAVVESLGSLGDRATVEVLEPPATLGRLRERLAGGEVHVLVVQGHGLLARGDAAGLVLEDGDGRLEVVDESAFAEVFHDARTLRLVTLLACHGGLPSTDAPQSGLAAALVERGVPAVVAFRRQVSVAVAALFLEHFLAHLGRSGRVDAAVNEARMQLYLARRESWDWGAPALTMRLPDARLWRESEASLPSRWQSSIRRGPERRSQDVDWDPILDRITSKDPKLIPILGPGVYQGLLPSRAEIAARWADDFGFPWNGSDRRNLPNVARFVETQAGKGYPHDLLPRLLLDDLLERRQVRERGRFEGLSLHEVIARIAEQYFSDDPDEPHRILAELPIANYVTTNPDSFMSAALGWVRELEWTRERRPRRAYCVWREELEEDFPEGYAELCGTPEEPLVFHLYGNDEEPTSQVLTEDDYLDFLRVIAADSARQRPIVIPERLGKELSLSMLLFLGFKIEDLGCRVLFRGLVKRLRDLRRGRVAVLQMAEEDRMHAEALRKFIKECCSDIKIERIYWGSARQFLVELRDRYREKQRRRHG